MSAISVLKSEVIGRISIASRAAFGFKCHLRGVTGLVVAREEITFLSFAHVRMHTDQEVALIVGVQKQ